MTPQARGKLLLTIIIIGIVVAAGWRWWDKIAPTGKENTPSAKLADITSKLLAGDKDAQEVGAAVIPPVKGTSDYDKTKKDGKLVVEFPINIWPGWAPIIMANNGLEPNQESIFYKKYGFYLKLSIVDDPVKARDLFASGHSHCLWGTLDMLALFAPSLVKDSRTVPVIPMQVDFSAGGDGIVARNEIRTINDLRMVNGKKKKGILAQNSPSHYFIMSMLINAGIEPSDIDFRWASDAPSAAKIFVQDPSFDFFVGWAPDIYTVSEGVKGTRLVVTTASANYLIADVFAVRNDFYRDNPEIVKGLVKGILEGVDMVRANVPKAAQLMSDAYGIPVEDCKAMIGKDGGITTGDAHLSNYRENANFFLNSKNAAGFDMIWTRASTIYQQLGAISEVVPPGKVKLKDIISELGSDPMFKNSVDMSQPKFNPNAVFSKAEADDSEILTKAVIIRFEPNSTALNPQFDESIPENIDSIGKLAGTFGNAYIVIEGNADASRKGVVPADMVRQLSYARAEAVKNALLEEFNFDPNKFKVVGNGWDNPIPGFTDPTDPEHRKRNRRVEVKVYPLEGE